MSYEQDARHELISRLRNVYSSGGAVKKNMCPRGTNKRCIPKDGLKIADEILRRYKQAKKEEAQAKKERAKPKRAKRTAKPKRAKPQKKESMALEYKPKPKSKSYRSYRELLKDIRALDPTGNYKDQQRKASKMWQELQGAGVSGGSGHLPYGVDDYSRTYNPNQYGIYQRPVDGGVMIDSNYGYDHRPTMRGYSQGTGSSGGVLVDSFYSH